MIIRLLIGMALGAAILALWPGAAPVAGPELPHPWEQLDEEITPEDFESLAGYAGRITPAELDASLFVINPYRTLTPYLARDEGALALLAAPGSDQALARVAWRDEAAGEPRDTPAGRPTLLAGLRIILDPGHFGGAFSETERRHFIIKDREPVREGDLNWGTALVLQKKLEQAGVEVILARGPPPEAPFPELDPADPALDSDPAMLGWLEKNLGGFATVRWLRDNPARLTRFRIAAAGALRAPGLAPERSLHHVFARYDYRRRGLMAGELDSDLLLSLHHNISGRSWVNRLVVFVPGFIRYDADNEPGRFFTFRRLLEGDTPMLAELAHDISLAMQEALEVPAHQYVKRPDFNKLPLFPSDGVFARNLGVLRRATGPAILVEGPCMNHIGENKKLLRQDFKIAGRPYPQRVKQYANAVFRAVKANAGALWQQRLRRRPGPAS